MPNPHIWPAFLAQIPPYFTSLNPFETFSDHWEPILTVTVGEVWEFPVKLRRFRSRSEKAVTRNKPGTRNQVASEWVKKISIRSWVEFTFYDYITLSFNYSYRYEIYLIRIMYAANSSILCSKEKTVRILGTWHQYLVNVSGLRYSKQIEFQEELISFLRAWLL